MGDAKFQPGIECERCGRYFEGNYVTDTDFRREWNGKDVCVSCCVTLRLQAQ